MAWGEEPSEPIRAAGREQRVEDCVCHLLLYYEGESLRELSICCQTNCQIGELLRAPRFYYMENGTCVLGLGVLFGCGDCFVCLEEGKREMKWIGAPFQEQKVVG